MTSTEATPPFHLVSGVTGKDQGPFTTYTDAMLARHIAGPEFQAAVILDQVAFDEYLRH